MGLRTENWHVVEQGDTKETKSISINSRTSARFVEIDIKEWEEIIKWWRDD